MATLGIWVWRTSRTARLSIPTRKFQLSETWNIELAGFAEILGYGPHKVTNFGHPPPLNLVSNCDHVHLSESSRCQEGARPQGGVYTANFFLLIESFFTLKPSSTKSSSHTIYPPSTIQFQQPPIFDVRYSSSALQFSHNAWFPRRYARQISSFPALDAVEDLRLQTGTHLVHAA